MNKPPASAKRPGILLKTLMWGHYLYLGVIPILGAFAIVIRGHAWGPLITIGWIIMVIYLSLHGANYKLTANPIKALLVVLLTPALTLGATLYFDQDVWFYLMQETAAQLGVMFLGMTIAMIIKRPSGWFGVGVMVLLGIPALNTYLIPIINEYRALPPGSWYFFAAIFASGLLTQSMMFYRLADAFNKTGAEQRPDRSYGGAGRMISPVTHMDKFGIIWIAATLISWVILMIVAANFFDY